MNRRRLARTVLAVSFAAAIAAALATGCSDSDSLIGGDCVTGLVICSQSCVDIVNDDMHCGGCDIQCASGTTCIAGMCQGASDASTDASSLDGSRDGKSDATTDGATPSDSGAGSLGDENDGGSPDGTLDDGASSEGSSQGNDSGDGSNASNESGSSSNEASTSTDSSLTDVTNSNGDSASSSDGSNSNGDSASSSDGSNSNGDSAGGDGASGDDADGGNSSVDTGTIDASDACPPGVYDTNQACGDCNTVCDGTTAICLPSDGGFACLPPCTGSLNYCGGICTDSTTDPFNCGHCGTTCPSQICQNSACVGTTSGGLVFIGHDYSADPVGQTQAGVLTNAVFIAQHNPLRVLMYTRYADPGSVMRITALVTAQATLQGRTLTLVPTIDDSDIPNTLRLQKYDVLLVPDQPNAPSGALALLDDPAGANWAPTVSGFAQVGGVVVILDGAGGVAEMPAFVTGTGLLTITSQARITIGSPLDDIAHADVESVGLVSPYAAATNTVTVSTEPNGGNVVYVVVPSNDAGVQSDAGPSDTPVVVHKVF